MSILFVNACMRADSRTLRLAKAVLSQDDAQDVEEIRIGTKSCDALTERSIVSYNCGVASGNYEDALFSPAKQFAQAEEVLIAAPLWNYGIPARLHDYLEIVCSQGITFDVDEQGRYVSLCHAKRLTFVTTMGGPYPSAENDHAFGYIRTLATAFWHIPLVRCVYAESLDMVGMDVEPALKAALDRSEG
ncbi:MAG: NAD(P)H-dependent oxidoreductase [Atopobiaceae bacterium]|nr:NAD(P)H-dependent oxidoreductase [Atopobiaceae bacterium]